MQCRLCLCLSACAIIWGSVTLASDVELLTTIADQQVQISNMEAIYTATVQLSPVENGAADRIVIRGQEVPLSPAPSGVTVSRCVFRRSAHRALYEIDPQSTTNAEPDGAMVPSILAYSTNRVEQRNRNSGSIRNDLRFPTHSVIDLALGFRERSAEGFLPADAWLGFRVAKQDDKFIVIEDGPRESTPGRFALHRWTFDLALGFAMTEYERLWRKGVELEWNTDIHVVNSGFRSVEGWMLPYSIDASLYHNPAVGSSVVTRRTTIDVDSYTLFAVEDSDEAFMVSWPQGATVHDQRNGHSYLIPDDETVLTDEYIARVFFPPPPAAGGLIRWEWLVLLNLLGLISIAMYFWIAKKRSTSVR